jgi:hypothetical protein
MENNFEDEDDIETDVKASLLYEMIATIEDELKEGSTLNDRTDSFAYYYEKLFEQSIDNIEDIEEAIVNQIDKINIYQIIRNEVANIYDKYFGITFNDIDSVPLHHIYLIYQVIYVGFIKMLCFYALGKGLENEKDGNQLFKEAVEVNRHHAIDIADYLVGNYIMNEDEFTAENIALALDKSDTGNVAYQYVFGEVINNTEVEVGDVFIDNNAFRLRVKSEYNNPAMKQLFEIVFSKLIDTLSLQGA